MVPYAKFAAKAYSEVDISTAVENATPHGLTLLVYDGALKQMGKALAFMRAKRTAEKGIAISKAIQIVDEGLRAPLDMSYGELPKNLGAIYEYIGVCLFQANLHNDEAKLLEAQRLLSGLRDTWAEIGPQVSVANAPNYQKQTAQQAVGY